ncbi:MAG: helix-turn-helix domain-containing protein, partial [Candidatus Limnocylindrales bacterium]
MRSPVEAADLSVTGAARMLGVHPNTVRAWTDQGRLRCLRINERGDRRYRATELQGFLHAAAPGEMRSEASGTSALAPSTDAAQPLSSAAVDPVEGGRLALLAELSRLCASTGDSDAALRAVASTLRRAGGFESVAIGERMASGMKLRVLDASARRKASGFELDARLVEVCLRDGRPIAAPRSPVVSGVTGRWRPPPVGSS